MRSIGFGPLVLCCSFVLHCVAYVRRRLKTYGHEDYHCNTKWRRKWHNCNTILVASNFSCVLPVHFFVVQQLCCSCAASLHFVLQNISSWECSRLAFARPVSMLLTCVEYDFSSLGVGRRTCLARDTNVGFRQMMQFWNHLIMSYHA